MRTHTYSIAIHAYEDGRWSVSIIDTPYSGPLAGAPHLVWGPSWPLAEGVPDLVREKVEAIQEQCRQEQRERVQA